MTSPEGALDLEGGGDGPHADSAWRVVVMVSASCVQGVSLAQAKDKGQLIFLEALKESLSVLIPQETSRTSDAMAFLRFTPTTFRASFPPLGIN